MGMFTAVIRMWSYWLTGPTSRGLERCGKQQPE